MWVDKPDVSTLRLIECAFPDGLQEAEYLPLLFVLREEMSLRAASHFAALIRGESDYTEEYMDALSVRGFRKPDMKVVDSIKQRLRDCGWYEWLDEEEQSNSGE